MKILVTGATGFVGGFCLKYLSEKFPDAEVIGTGRNKISIGELTKQGYKIIGGDITEPDFIRKSFADVSHVVHCAARTTMWGKYSDFYKDNVQSTEYLVNEIPGLRRFVLISTANIYFNWKDRLNVRENDTLPGKYHSHYPLTKLMAEEVVLNNRKGVHGIALRPRGIIGPGDTTGFPRLIKALKEDKVRIVGPGTNVLDFTSVLNLAHAAELAIKASDSTAGNAYNITDGSTHLLWTLLEETMKGLSYNKPLRRVSYQLLYVVAALAEFLALFRKGEATIHRYGVSLLKTSFTLNIEKAKAELGYKPMIRTEDSLAESLEWANNSNLL